MAGIRTDDTGAERGVLRHGGNGAEDGEGVPAFRILSDPDSVNPPGVGRMRYSQRPPRSISVTVSGPGVMAEIEGEAHEDRSALPLGSVIQDHTAAPLIPLPHHDAGTIVVHGVGIAAVELGGDIVGDDRCVEVMPRAFPDSGVARQRPHTVPIARMSASDIAKRIRSG